MTVNDTRGDHDVDGLIKVGLDPVPASVTFDGLIRVKDNPFGPGGDLWGSIIVVGCHGSTDDLDICIDGLTIGNEDNVKILQKHCPNQVDWSCVSGAP